MLEKKALREFFDLNRPRSWMQYLELKIHLEGRGYNCIEDRGLLAKRREDLEENAAIIDPLILPDESRAGSYTYFIKPEVDEYEKLPDTLPGGFIVEKRRQQKRRFRI